MSVKMRAWVVSVAGLAAFGLVAYISVRFLLPALLPFVLALLFAMMIERPVAWLQRVHVGKYHVPRSAAVALVLLVAFTVIVTAVFWLAVRLMAEIRFLYAQGPYLVSIGQDLFQRGLKLLGSARDALPPGMADAVQNSFESALRSLQSALPGVASALSAVSTLTFFLADLGIAIIATFFISRDKDAVVAFLSRFLPPGWRPALGQARRDVFQSLAGYLKAVLILVSITTTITTLGLWLVGSEYALLIGVLTGVVDLIPIVGTTTVFIPWIAYEGVFGSSTYAVKLLLVYLVQLGVRQALEPKMVGERMGIHPLTLLFTAYVGYQIFGAMGFLWGPLLAIFTKALIKSGVLPAFGPEEKPPRV